MTGLELFLLLVPLVKRISLAVTGGALPLAEGAEKLQAATSILHAVTSAGRDPTAEEIAEIRQISADCEAAVARWTSKA